MNAGNLRFGSSETVRLSSGADDEVPVAFRAGIFRVRLGGKRQVGCQTNESDQKTTADAN
jgi:hypothetical protein